MNERAWLDAKISKVLELNPGISTEELFASKFVRHGRTDADRTRNK